MGRSKKATQATQAAKKRRNKAKRQTRGTNPIANASFPDSRAMVLNNPFDATAQGALIELAPELTVEEYHKLRDTGDNPKPDEYDLVDPTLTRILQGRREWESYEDGTWDHVPNRDHAATAWGEFAQPLHIAVGFAAADGPRWEVHHPSPDEDFRTPAETYTSRDALLAELDRLEHLGHQPIDTRSIP
ncbi:MULTISPECIES: hypothetical protein [Rhodococcus]|uniref:HNH endonuclease n=2 Tax=Rhodococcus opacus TaxID=37919 RepID=A0AAX3YUA0_RHOOP|nr:MULTISPECIES: hypothetical protein [Rhodococcus]QSE86028.1 hypothetical protein JWS14_44005 [Rhodococcus koreensis]WLF51880.1 hypothetical protein Q5707_41140 [Rhodococcus opacus]WLF52323.1 hypothetical protein Q5707_43855 [Rhodococcus opacus]